MSANDPSKAVTSDTETGSSPESGQPSGKPSLGGLQPRARFSMGFFLVVLAAMSFAQWAFYSDDGVPVIAYSLFIKDVTENRVDQVVLLQDQILGKLKSDVRSDKATVPSTKLAPSSGKTPWHVQNIVDWWRGLEGDVERGQVARAGEVKLHFSVVPLENPKLLALLQSHNVEYSGQIESDWLKNLFLSWIIPFGVMILIWGYVMKRMGRGPGVLQMGQSKAKIYEVDASTRVHFTDIAGADEAIEETREIVTFLANPKAFSKVGAKLPKGVLLVGPPGTGKTLLARAIAGESGVPFYSLSGSDFVEMFVGVGAARVRDLFKEAKKAAPCIVFIDELDAIGKSRSPANAFASGGYDERENTLNQLLVEMDGFDSSSGVVILAATNRPEVLDAALLRPGRFDRRVVVDRPNLAGREAIFGIHSKALPLAADIELKALAAQTPGMVGADIANVCNEAALLTSRTSREKVEMRDFQEAIERAIAGPQMKSRIVTPEERKRIAYHESGHALVAHLTVGGDPVQKISIIPRSNGALGYTIQMPLEDRYLLTEDELLNKVRVLLAGRAAESVVFGNVSTGASDDLAKANEIVREMLTTYGMSKKLPNLSLNNQHGSPFLGLGGGTSQADQAQSLIDAELIEIIGKCYEDAKGLLSSSRDRLESLATCLLDVEQLDRSQLLSLLGASPVVTVSSDQLSANNAPESTIL